LLARFLGIFLPLFHILSQKKTAVNNLFQPAEQAEIKNSDLDPYSAFQFKHLFEDYFKLPASYNFNVSTLF